MGIIGIIGIIGIMGVAGAAKLCRAGIPCKPEPSKKHTTNLRDTAQLCRSGIPCNQSHQKKHHTNLRAAVRKDRGSGGKKIVEERNNCHPTGAEPAAKNLVIFPQKSGKMTNLFDANSPPRRPACQATYPAPGRAGRQGCRGRAQSPLQKANANKLSHSRK